MALLPGYCQHCGSGFIETTKDHIWHCQKCGRGEVKPFVAKEAPAEIIGRQIDIEMENRMCENPACDKTFEARPGSNKIFCSGCQGMFDARNYRKKCKEEGVERRR